MKTDGGISLCGGADRGSLAISKRPARAAHEANDSIARRASAPIPRADPARGIGDGSRTGNFRARHRTKSRHGVRLPVALFRLSAPTINQSRCPLPVRVIYVRRSGYRIN